MLYTTFIRLCDEAVKHNDLESFIAELGWQEWMNKTSGTEEILKELSLIFELASLDFAGMRKRLGISMNKMATMYRIPLRTIENWESVSESNSHKASPYLFDFIRYAIFVRELEGDDGYIGYITEQD